MKLFLVAFAALVLSVNSVNGYTCYACNVPGASESCKHARNITCPYAYQSCLKTVESDGSVTKGCAVDQYRNPLTLPDDCIHQQGRTVCGCNHDYCNYSISRMTGLGWIMICVVFAAVLIGK